MSRYNNENPNKFADKAKEFLNNFKDWFIKNFFIYMFMCLLRRNMKYLLAKDTYKSLRHLFKYRYVYFNSEDAKKSYIISDKEAEFYISIINKLPSYEKFFLQDILGFIYDEFPTFNDNELQNPELYYDGFDVGRYVIHKKIFGKNRYYKIIKRSNDEEYCFTINNGEIIHIFPFNFLFYIPISNSIKRKKVIKSLLN